jgi:hypothetical protein
MGVEKLFHTGIRFSDRLAPSESLYRLRYPGPLSTELQKKCGVLFIYII